MHQVISDQGRATKPGEIGLTTKTGCRRIGCAISARPGLPRNCPEDLYPKIQRLSVWNWPENHRNEPGSQPGTGVSCPRVHSCSEGREWQTPRRGCYTSDIARRHPEPEGLGIGQLICVNYQAHDEAVRIANWCIRDVGIEHFADTVHSRGLRELWPELNINMPKRKRLVAKLLY